MMTIEGDGFAPGAQVAIAARLATQVEVLSATRLQAVVPAALGEFGLVPVAVQNPDGQQYQRRDLFRYYSSQISFSRNSLSAPTGDRGTRGLAVGDFNGDSIPDLAVTNSSSGTVSLYTGTGRGAFSKATDFSLGAILDGIGAGDFNGDGKLDLAVAKYDSYGDGVALLFGDGQGGFKQGTDLLSGRSPAGVVVADLNGDNYLDLAVYNYSATAYPASVVTVLLGDGMGGFGPATEFPLGWFGLHTAPYTHSLVAADFNGDAKLDLALPNRSGNTLSVLLGDGQGNFGTPTSFATQSAPSFVAVGDFNRDQKPDLAITNYDSGSVSVWLGDGMGGFATTADLPVSALAASVAVGDIDGDGVSDLAVTHGRGPTMVLIGDGTGGFSAPVSVGPGGGPWVVAADLNGDQRSDLTVTDNDQSVFVFLNQSK